MKLILTIVFNSRVKTRIKIENPPYVPNIGDIVDIDPDEYLADPEEINNLKEFAENGVWMVDFKTTTYRKEVVEVLIALDEEKQFEKN